MLSPSIEISRSTLSSRALALKLVSLRYPKVHRLHDRARQARFNWARDIHGRLVRGEIKLCDISFSDEAMAMVGAYNSQNERVRATRGSKKYLEVREKYLYPPNYTCMWRSVSKLASLGLSLSTKSTVQRISERL